LIIKLALQPIQALLVGTSIACLLMGAATLAKAQDVLPFRSGPSARGAAIAEATPEPAMLIGRWVRPDGGYAMVIKSVDPSGRMDATYSNPNRINVSRAEVSVDGGSLRLSIELRDVGYPGSTYMLTYVPTGDRLAGVYFQAATSRTFAVVFERER